MTKVVPFEQAPSAERLVERIRSLAMESANLRYSPKHFKERLDSRQISMRQVLETVRRGEPVGAPRKDEFGDWRVKLKWHSAGRKVQVVVAVQPAALVIVTVM
jgi:hypothetical protein